MVAESPTTKVTLSVPSVHCGHCVRTIVRELKALPEVVSVEGSPETKEISVEYSDDALSKIKTTLSEIGYPAAG
jgi:copper chaperone